MSAHWRNFLAGVFLAGFLFFLGLFVAVKPRILVLGSSAEDTLWSQKFKQGAGAVLERNRRPLSVEWCYLDVPDRASGASAVAAAEARRTVERIRPDVLIAVDDPANAFIAREYPGLALPRIIYVSINELPGHYGYNGRENVSGIADRLPLDALRDLAGDLQPRASRRIAALGLRNEAVMAELEQVRAFDWSPHRLVASDAVRTFEEWRRFVRESGADLLIVLDAGHMPRSVDDAGTVSGGDVVRWTEANSKALPVGTGVGFVPAGGSLSFAPPPDDYGEKAMELAIDWLDDRESPGAPPPVESSSFEVAIRQGLLRARGLTVPPIYTEAARENGTLYP
ncbi:MAG: hypothetical protein FGM15_10840 [Chthoniobacterales bacterium]|nr:hypothetical protein [Chthoniobacterales bacterium]